MSSWKHLLFVAVIAFAAAIGGVYAGRTILASRQPDETELHALLHRELGLNVEQVERIHTIEQRFAIRRRALELEMRAANAHLADAMQAEHGYGPEVTAAVDHTHEVMGELQKETLEHLFAMRAVLTSEQAAKFDKTVAQALAPASQ